MRLNPRSQLAARCSTQGGAQVYSESIPEGTSPPARRVFSFIRVVGKAVRHKGWSHALRCPRLRLLSVHPCRPRPHVRARALFRVRTDALHNRHAEHAAHSPFLSSGFPPWPSLIPPLSHDASTHSPKPAQAHTCTLPLFTPSRRAIRGLSCRRRPKSTTRSSDASWPRLQPALHSLPNRAGSAPLRVGATPSSE